jgi:hydrogenase maturation protease
MVIGVGNEARGDDAAGILVARRLAALDLPGVRCLFSPADALGLLDEWPSYREVIIVDAACSGAPAGSIHRIDAIGTALPGHLRPISSHGFGVVEVVELARVLGRLPRRLTVYGLEGRCFDDEAPPTAECSRAIDNVVREIQQQISDGRALVGGGEWSWAS